MYMRTHTHTHTHTDFSVLFLRNCLMQFCGLSSWNSAGQASRSHTQGGAELSLKSEVHLEAEFHLPQRTSVFFLWRLSTHWMVSTHITWCNLLYSKPTDLNDNLIFLKKSSQKLLYWLLTKYLSTVVWPSWCIKLTTTIPDNSKLSRQCHYKRSWGGKSVDKRKNKGRRAC